MIGRCAVVAGFLTALLGAGAEAAAPEPAPLVVFHAPAGAPDVAARAAEARAVLEGVARERGTALLDLSPAPLPPPATAQALRQAIDAYHEFRFGEAQAQLERVLDEARQTGARGLSPDQLGDAHIYMGLVATERGDTSLAWDSLVRAATLDPTRHLDPVRFPPRVVESFQRALAAVTQTGPAALRIDVDHGCAVRLDGRPVRAADEQTVVPGHHYLDVRCPGHAPYGALAVIAGPRALLRPGLAALQPPALAELRALARDRGARTLLVALVSASPDAAPTLSMRLIQVDSGSERGSAMARLTGPKRSADVRRAAERLIDQVVAPRPLIADPTTDPSAGPPAPRSAPRWYRRPWVWGVTGAALSAAILLPFLADDEPAGGFGVRLGGQLPQ